MTLKELYKKLKNGWELVGDYGRYIYIDTCDNWGSPSHGKEYIYFQNYGSSASSVSFENFKFIVQNTFDCITANQLLEKMELQ